SKDHSSIISISGCKKDARRASGEAQRIVAGIFKSFPGHFQRQPMLWIQAGRLSRGNAKEVGIELGRIVEECAESRRHFSRPIWIGIEIAVKGPAGRGYLMHGVNAMGQ